MKWKPFNFEFIIPKEFEKACHEVYPKKNCLKFNKAGADHSSAAIRIIFHDLTLNQKKEAIPEKQIDHEKTIEKKTKFGELKFTPLKNELNIFLKNVFHPPQLISSILMQLIKMIGIKYDCFLIHSASVSVNKKAILIPGKQNRGKTTLSKNIPKARMINDDLSLIVKDYTNNFYIFKIPEINDLTNKKPFLWDGPFELKKIFFIRRDKESFIKPLKTSEAIKSLNEEDRPFVFSNNLIKYNEALGKYTKLINKMLKVTPSFCISYKPLKDKSLLKEITIK